MSVVSSNEDQHSNRPFSNDKYIYIMIPIASKQWACSRVGNVKFRYKE